MTKRDVGGQLRAAFWALLGLADELARLCAEAGEACAFEDPLDDPSPAACGLAAEGDGARSAARASIRRTLRRTRIDAPKRRRAA